MKTALKSSLFVAILAGLMVFPFSGFGLMEFSPEEPSVVQTASVLGASDVAVRSRDSIKNINVVHQEDLTLNLSADSTQKFYNVLPEEYVSNQYEIIVVVPNELKDEGLTASLSKSELTYDLEVELENSNLEFQQVELSLIVVSRL